MANNAQALSVDLDKQLKNQKQKDDQKKLDERIAAFKLEETAFYLNIDEQALKRKNELYNKKEKFAKDKLELQRQLFATILLAYNELSFYPKINYLNEKQNQINAYTKIKKKIDNGADPNFFEIDVNHSYLNFLMSTVMEITLHIEIGVSPLMFAIALKSEMIVECLLNNGADINAANALLQTPLMFACSMGLDNIVQLLIKHNAEVHHFCKDNQGLPGSQDKITSAFHIACLNCSLETVQMMRDKYYNHPYLIQVIKHCINSPLLSTIRGLSNIRNTIQFNKKDGKRKIEPKEVILENVIAYLVLNNSNLSQEFFAFGLNSPVISPLLFTFEKLINIYPTVVDEVYLATLIEIHLKDESHILSNVQKSIPMLTQYIHENLKKLLINQYLEDNTKKLFPHLIFERPTLSFKHSDLQKFNTKLPYQEIIETLLFLPRPLLSLIMEYHTNTISNHYQSKVKQFHNQNLDMVLTAYKSELEKNSKLKLANQYNELEDNPSDHNFQAELDKMKEELNNL